MAGEDSSPNISFALSIWTRQSSALFALAASPWGWRLRRPMVQDITYPGAVTGSVTYQVRSWEAMGVGCLEGGGRREEAAPW